MNAGIPELLIDSNVLVLGIVGMVDRRQISRHRRARLFTEDHYDYLLDLMNRATRICVTPNTVTETANLLDYGDRSMRYQYRSAFKGFVQSDVVELVVASEEAVDSLEFLRLGVTDCVLLTLVSANRWLLTADLDLYLAAVSRSPGAVINFTEYVEQAMRG